MLQYITATNGALGFKNTSNAWIWIYSQGSVTITDSTGKTVKITTAPCWVGPGWTINTGTSTDILMGLQGDTIEDFRGFLSRRSSSSGAPVSSGLQVSGALPTIGAKEQEFEAFQFGQGSITTTEQVRGYTTGASIVTGQSGESEAVTHS